jgi:hypothetical protein
MPRKPIDLVPDQKPSRQAPDKGKGRTNAQRRVERIAKQRECARLKFELKLSNAEIGERVGSTAKWVEKLLRKEFSLPSQDTEMLRGIERKKLDSREMRANQMYLSNIERRQLLDEKGNPQLDPSTGKPVVVQYVPPNVLAAYGAEMDRIAARRARFDATETPVRIVMEQEFDSRFAALQTRISPEALEAVVDVFSGNYDSASVESQARPGAGSSSTH